MLISQIQKIQLNILNFQWLLEMSSKRFPILVLRFLSEQFLHDLEKPFFVQIF